MKEIARITQGDFGTGTNLEAFVQRIEKLPEREMTVIALYYYEGLTLKEIGQVLGVTESRVSQLHTKAVLRLKSRLQEDGDL